VRIVGLDTLGKAAANGFDLVFGGGVADRTHLPASIIDEGPQRAIFRYLQPERRRPRGAPVLLVPPLAAPATCMDLRPGCSLAEHLLAAGHPTYLVDYGPIAFSDRELGLEHWIEEVIPHAIRRVSEDAGGQPVAVVGWCLGGIMSLLAVAADPDVPVSGVATIASPFDFKRVRLVAPLRPVDDLTGGQFISALYRVMGGAPAPLVRYAYQAAAIDKQILKPWAILSHLDDREFLAQIAAVDAFMGDMHAYPGRTFGQLYHRFFRVNELAAGRLELPDRTVDLADVDVPVLVVAGEGDSIAPRGAVFHVAELLPNAPDVWLETAPGGHLGVLTGRGARTTTWRYLDEFLDELALAPLEEAVSATAA
jgi:poly[(R)-3-hydroxyalkanoate] polymerase subunit PhaC